MSLWSMPSWFSKLLSRCDKDQWSVENIVSYSFRILVPSYQLWRLCVANRCFLLFNVNWKICTTLMLKRHNMLSWHKGIVEIAPDQKAREDVSHAEPVIDMEFTNTAPHTIILTFCCILSVSGCPSTWGMSLFLGEMSSGGKVRFFQGNSLSAD